MLDPTNGSSKLLTLDDAFKINQPSMVSTSTNIPTTTSTTTNLARRFPYYTCMKWVFNNPKVIKPGLLLSIEILESYFFSRKGKKQ